MTESRIDAELQDLLAELLDGSLDGDARKRLNELLSGDAAAQSTYLDFCEAHSALAWEHGLVVADVSPSVPVPATSAVSGHKSVRVAAIVATIAASLLLAVTWWSRGRDRRQESVRQPTADAPVVAQLLNRIDAVVTAEEVSWEADEIRVGQYKIERGLIQLRFASGVLLFIEAPAAFDAISAERIALHAGRVSAQVPPEGSGFTIETPEADVVDFGTEFSIEVGSGESEVHVFSGHVQVSPKLDDAAQVDRSIDLRTHQAIRIADSSGQPVGIDLATDRFIRSIDEPQKEYPRVVRRLKPVAYYRMPIRQRGLVCVPSVYEGTVLTGAGSRPACAPGIIGGALRVGGRSIGRGATVEATPPFETGAFALSCWIYPTGRPDGGTVVSDMDGKSGRFSLSLDRGTGRLLATIRDDRDQLVVCRDIERLALDRWHHIAVTCDRRELRMYRDGESVSSAICSPISTSAASSLSIGVAHDRQHLWEGRIDELALFDQSLSSEQVKALYEAALE